MPERELPLRLISGVINTVGMSGKSTELAQGERHQLRHEPVFFCSSLVKIEPKWMSPEEFKFETNKQTNKQTSV